MNCKVCGGIIDCFSTNKTVTMFCNNKACSEYGKILIHDPVHAPKHYKKGGIETIDYLLAKLSPEAFMGFLIGNVLKYVSRYQDKNGLEDLEKAQFYLQRAIKHYPLIETIKEEKGEERENLP